MKAKLSPEGQKAIRAQAHQVLDRPKLSHAAVEFEHPAQGKDHCSLCEHYLGSACEIVKDPIRPQDWCNHFRSQP